MESGLRSFGKEMPEETNRILKDHLIHLLFAPTSNAVKNLRNEQINSTVFNTGDISVEVIDKASKIAGKSDILNKLKIEPQKYLLLTMHRAENTKR